MWLLAIVVLVFRVTCAEPRDQASYVSFNYSLLVGTTQRFNLARGLNYSFRVNFTSHNLSAIVFQLHAQRDNITLEYSAQDCQGYGCQTVGTDVGLVSIVKSGNNYAQYTAFVGCHGNQSDPIPVLAAAVSLAQNVPIPGGCTLTSALDIDPNLSLTLSTYETKVVFQDGDTGFPNGGVPPVCDGSTPGIGLQSLEYHMHNKYLPPRNYDPQVLFSIIEQMLTPMSLEEYGKDPTYSAIKHGDVKRVTYDSIYGQGVVYNVIAMDTGTQATSAYIPRATYACDFYSEEGCSIRSAVIDKVLSPFIGIAGLFLCFLGQHFFDAEIVIFNFLIFLYIGYLVLASATNWSHTVTLVGGLVISVVMTTLLFLLWFFTGWYLPFVLWFGGIMGFLLTAVVLFTPIGSLVAVFQVGYVYGLLLACGLVLWMIPCIAFPPVLNIVSSSLIGSYTFIFAICTYSYSPLLEVVMEVVKNASVTGYLQGRIDYPFESTDIGLSVLWLTMFVSGLMVQVAISLYSRHRRGPVYRAFPEKPFKRFRHWMQKGKRRGHMVATSIWKGERQPLLAQINPRYSSGESWSSSLP